MRSLVDDWLIYWLVTWQESVHKHQNTTNLMGSWFNLIPRVTRVMRSGLTACLQQTA